MSVTPSAAALSLLPILPVPPVADAPAGSQCYVLRDGAREIRIILVAPASAAPTPLPEPAAAPVASVRVSVDGATVAGRTEVVINGERRALQDRWFVVLLRLVVAAHLRGAGAWSSRADLAMGRTRNAPTYIRKAFAGLVPVGLDVVEADRRGRFRLNPAIVVEAPAWDALADHPNPGVQRVVAEQRRRDARR